jgi:hypothetical protein
LSTVPEHLEVRNAYTLLTYIVHLATEQLIDLVVS